MRSPIFIRSNWIENAPLYGRLRRLGETGRLSFHMPAWRGRFRAPSEWDTTELPWSEDLNDPGPCLKEASRRLADFYGAARAYFLTEGSSFGLMAALLAAAGRGGKVLASSDIHRFLIQAAQRFSLHVAFAEQERKPFTPIASPGSACLRRALAAKPDAAVLLFAYPDYYGAMPSPEEAKELWLFAREQGLRLVLDAAHGALLPLMGRRFEADIVVCSAHKTMPAPTGAAFLLLMREDEALTAAVETALRLLRSSSPPLYVAAAADLARAFCASAEGQRAYEEQLCFIRKLAGELPEELLLYGGDPAEKRRDPLRVVLEIREGPTGFRLQRELAERQIDIEMADPKRLLLIPSLLSEETDYSRLASALRLIFHRLRNAPAIWRKAPELEAIDADYRALFMSPRRAWPPEDFAEAEHAIPGLNFTVESLPLSQAAGRRVAGSILAYPPGLAAVWPGERFTEPMLQRLHALSCEGLHFTGAWASDGLGASEAPGSPGLPEGCEARLAVWPRGDGSAACVREPQGG